MKKINYCKKCGIKLEFEDAELCPSCKTIFSDSYIYYFDYCPNCGTKLDLSANTPIEICPHCGVRIIERTDFHLTDFVSENSGLFITSSIFIALAMYLSQLGLNVDKSKFILLSGSFQINIFDTAIGASILLSLLISSLIVKKMIVKFYQFRFSHPKNYMSSFAGVKVGVFLALFSFLLGGLFIYFYTIYRIVFTIFVLITAYALAPYPLWILYKILHFDMNAVDFQGRKKVKYFFAIGFCCLFFFLCGLLLIILSIIMKTSELTGILGLFLGFMFLSMGASIFADFLFLFLSVVYDLLKWIFTQIKYILNRIKIRKESH